jgi:hypothetical protein
MIIVKTPPMLPQEISIGMERIMYDSVVPPLTYPMKDKIVEISNFILVNADKTSKLTGLFRKMKGAGIDVCVPRRRSSRNKAENR